ncbi:RNA polymerase subunit sigma-54 [Celeribacter neptunius]|uniref:RNA polymerase sigma-54 factor n=1 Tax=Celeribacter neptunius TaxID=588602 RepID=A0A1I3VLF0_9RHOB|nr:RNA polymerase subunit sigma-54 [Celeribacter neptunius]SFJ96065.1 RNA polymerase, sigma 54 subunit, RpoN/SigL [Celeribacter neptunius]
MSFSTRLQIGQAPVFRMGHVINVLQMSGAELEDHLMQAARENPFLVMRRRRNAVVRAGNALDLPDVDRADAPTSLFDHVLRELAGLLAHGGAMERLVLALVEELEPSGWLGRGAAEIAAELGLAETLVAQALRLVQHRISPAGLFARDLAECLRLQLEDQGLRDAEIDKLLDCLELLETGGLAALTEATGLSGDRVEHHLARLRRLDPKPGVRFSTDLTLLRAPDVRVEPRGDGWIAIVKPTFETEVSVLPEVTGGSSPELRLALKQARALKQALDLRKGALEQIMHYMVDVQSDYFRDGPEALHPLSRSVIAEGTGFHLSTVCRVLNGLLVEGPHGIFEARMLCAQTASRGAEGGPSKPRVLSRLRAALSEESPACPLSDQGLADRLCAEGLRVSRRVVAKYRHELGFAPASQRRLRA